ncbi:MAG: SWIM zinc finger family protein, partial [Lachnospiraceae bacterium]|nr:SWIM zinc finger family protein [Lachnospiraceae bacterium]
MEDWKTLLTAVDDDYLVGMANKGLVKRAYKDMEAGDYKVLSADGEAQVSVGTETVMIRQPLGESTCSCPSRTICRHVLLGILALREYAGRASAGGEEEGAAEEEKAGKAEESPAERKKGEAAEESGNGGMKETEELPKEEGKEDLKAHLLEEIKAYPLPALKKLLGAKQLVEIARQMQVGQLPEITYSSVAAVRLPKGGYSVKLLSPLEYSTCSCHKKEFCAHKAAALLWCKLTAGQVKPAELGTEEALQDYDFGQVREAAAQMKVFLEELLDTGLARVSPDVLDYLDRLALISHNAKLANFEGYWRALHDSYGNYLKRKASFDAGRLMEQFARLYQRVELLGKSKDAVQISLLAGEFRSEYALIGNLDLAGIAMEHFESQTGYEGETVYFLEENTKEWYTYTSARPVFYETNRRRGRQEKAAAPWELPVSLEELVGLRIHLSGARADARGRLSASSETKGEVTGNCRKENSLHTGDLGDWYYRDFGKLFARQVDMKRMPWLKGAKAERRAGELVVLRPYS